MPVCLQTTPRRWQVRGILVIVRGASAQARDACTAQRHPAVSARLVNREEAVDCAVTRYCLPLQMVCLVDLTFADQWSHVNFDGACHFLSAHAQVNELEVASLPLVAISALSVEV